jgi:hypothetical protein
MFPQIAALCGASEFDFEANLRSGGDVDILVEDVELAEACLNQCLAPAAWQVARSYVKGYFSIRWSH